MPSSEDDLKKQRKVVDAARTVVEKLLESDVKTPSLAQLLRSSTDYYKAQKTILDDMEKSVITPPKAANKNAVARLNRRNANMGNVVTKKNAVARLNRGLANMRNVVTKKNAVPRKMAAPVNRPEAPMEAPTCFEDPAELNITKNTTKRHLCDKNFTRRIVEEGGRLESIYATSKVIGSGTFGSVMNAEIRFDTESGEHFKCVGVYKTEKRKTDFLEPDVAAEIACYARLMKKPCLSKGIFIKLSTGDNKSVMENYISDLDHIFWSGQRPSTLVSTDTAVLNDMVRAISYQMLTGLKGMHDEKIMHRDIKPANTFIAYDGEIVLGDFGGCFHAALGFKKLNRFYGIRGTPMYTAPEARIPEYGPKCDLWSIGACIYEFITRSYLIGNDFNYKSTNDVYIRYVNSKLDGLRVNPDAKSLIVALLNPDQSARPSAERCLSHPWFAGLTLARAQDIVVRSLNGQCMIKANKKVANTLTRHNRGVIKNDQSNAFMRIHEGVGWSPQPSRNRNTAVNALFKIYVIEKGYRLIKFLHTIELFDRLIQVDPSILDNFSKYMMSCATLAELLSSEGYTGNGWHPVFTSTKAAAELRLPVRDVEQTMRKIIGLLGGDIFIVPNGIVTKVASTEPRNAGDFISAVNEIVEGVELSVKGGALDKSFASFSEKYL